MTGVVGLVQVVQVVQGPLFVSLRRTHFHKCIIAEGTNRRPWTTWTSGTLMPLMGRAGRAVQAVLGNERPKRQNAETPSNAGKAPNGGASASLRTPKRAGWSPKTLASKACESATVAIFAGQLVDAGNTKPIRTARTSLRPISQYHQGMAHNQRLGGKPRCADFGHLSPRVMADLITYPGQSATPPPGLLKFFYEQAARALDHRGSRNQSDQKTINPKTF